MKHLPTHLLTCFVFFTLFGCQQPTTENDKTSSSQSGGIDRTVLPIKEPTYPAYSELDARNAKAPERFEVKAPEKAPNVVVVLIDEPADVGTDSNTPVTAVYHHNPRFNGKIRKVTIEVM